MNETSDFIALAVHPPNSPDELKSGLPPHSAMRMTHGRVGESYESRTIEHLGKRSSEGVVDSRIQEGQLEEDGSDSREQRWMEKIGVWPICSTGRQS